MGKGGCLLPRSSIWPVDQAEPPTWLVLRTVVPILSLIHSSTGTMLVALKTSGAGTRRLVHLLRLKTFPFSFLSQDFYTPSTRPRMNQLIRFDSGCEIHPHCQIPRGDSFCTHIPGHGSYFTHRETMSSKINMLDAEAIQDHPEDERKQAVTHIVSRSTIWTARLAI